jgi:glycosyltransferase involved in cell wall biosynthesis
MGMRIGWLDYSSLPGGGQLGLVRYLRRAGAHEHRLYLLQDGWLADEARALGIEVTVDEDARLRRIPATRRLVRAARDENDIVVANGRHIANLAALASHRNAVFLAYLHEDLSVASMTVAKRIIITRILLPTYDGFLANSEWTASTVPSNLHTKPLSLVYTLSGVDDTSPARRDVFSAARRLRVLSLSRLEEWKGVHVLVDAVAQLSDEARQRIEVTIAGAAHFSSNHYAQRLREIVRRKGLPITFLGHVQDVDALLEGHDVLAHCSVRPEPFGQVIVQALHAGLAVVATDGGGAAELIRPETNGVLTAHGDARALAGILDRLATDPAEVSRLAQAGGPSVAAFTDTAMAGLLDRTLTSFAVDTRNGG